MKNIGALTGRHKQIRYDTFYVALSGLFVPVFYSQGVALGYHVPPRWGENDDYIHDFICDCPVFYGGFAFAGFGVYDMGSI